VPEEGDDAAALLPRRALVGVGVGRDDGSVLLGLVGRAAGFIEGVEVAVVVAVGVADLGWDGAGLGELGLVDVCGGVLERAAALLTVASSTVASSSPASLTVASSRPASSTLASSSPTSRALRVRAALRAAAPPASWRRRRCFARCRSRAIASSP
jgi:hypothetical protein